MSLYDLSDIQAITETELREAIDELQQSTAAVDRQTDALRQQEAALARLLRKNSEAEARRQNLQEAHQRKACEEQKFIAAEVSHDY